METKEANFDATRNLIVNYLPASLNQDDVRNLFQRAGAVKNCKLMRNFETGESLGYAFIEYETASCAQKAIDTINGINLEGKTVRVSYARKSSPDTKDTNVYVAGLPDWVSEEKLKDLFSPFGEIASLKVLGSKPGTTIRGVGFVRFAYKSDAEKAIEAMAGKKLPEAVAPLTVKFAIPPASKHQNMQTILGSSISATANLRYNPMAVALPTPIMQPLPKPAQPVMPGDGSLIPASGHSTLLTSELHSVYVFGLSPTSTDISLYQLFSPFGSIMNVKTVQDITKDDKPCKGFGFVNFRKYDEAYRAVISMNGFVYEGKILQVSFKKQKGAAHESTPGIPVSPAFPGSGGHPAGPGIRVGGGAGINASPLHSSPTMQGGPNAPLGFKQDMYGQDYGRSGGQAYEYY